MLGKKNVNMLEGSVFKGLLAMSVPIIVMNVMQTLFNVLDMTILGNYANDTAVGAVGACGTLITMCTSLLIGISAGANVVVARHIGAKDSKCTREAVGTAIMFSIVGSIVLMIVGFLCAETFLKWTNCPASLLPQATLYFRIYFLGVPVIMLYNFSASILRATGDTKRPMYFLMLASVIKLIFSFCFILFLDMTVDGVAIATIIANATGAFLSFSTVLKSKDKLFFTVKDIHFYAQELKDILYVGIPTGLQSAMYSLANTVIITAVNSFGPDATTGVSIANQFDGILYYIAYSPALAAIPYISQNVGAKNFQRARKAVLLSICITVMFGASFGALSAGFSGQLSSMMSSTPAVIAYSQQKMIIISSTYFICGINEVMGGALKGIGKPIIPTISTFLFMCVIRFFWVYLIFPLHPNLTFLYLIWPIGWLLSITMQVIAYVPAMKKLGRKAIESTEQTA